MAQPISTPHFARPACVPACLYEPFQRGKELIRMGFNGEDPALCTPLSLTKRIVCVLKGATCIFPLTGIIAWIAYKCFGPSSTSLEFRKRDVSITPHFDRTVLEMKSEEKIFTTIYDGNGKFLETFGEGEDIYFDQANQALVDSESSKEVPEKRPVLMDPLLGFTPLLHSSLEQMTYYHAHNAELVTATKIITPEEICICLDKKLLDKDMFYFDRNTKQLLRTEVRTESLKEKPAEVSEAKSPPRTPSFIEEVAGLRVRAAGGTSNSN